MSCSVRTTRMEGVNAKNFDEVFATLIAQGISPDELFDSVCKQVMSAQSCQSSLLFPLAKICVEMYCASQGVLFLAESGNCADSTSNPSQPKDIAVQAHSHCNPAGAK